MANTVKIALLSLLVCAGVLLPLRAEDADPKSGYTETVRVELVQFNVLAVDRDGKPVLDLKPEDLDVSDAGVKQKVAFVERVDRAELRPGAQTAAAPAGPATPGAAAPTSRRTIMLLFDNYASNLRTRHTAIKAAHTFVEKELLANDRVAVVSFNGKLNIIQSFTSDAAKILGAIDVAAGEMDHAGGDRESAIDTVMEQMSHCKSNNSQTLCLQPYAAAFVEQAQREADAYMTALLQLVRSMAPIPEVKQLVFFSEGFARSPHSDALDLVGLAVGPDAVAGLAIGADFVNDRELDRFSEAAAKARVSVFTINPGGASRFGTLSARVGTPGNESQNRSQVDVYSHMEKSRQAALVELARRSGGRAMLGSDPGVELKRVVALAPGIYTAGFYPTLSRVAEDWHELKVKSRRKGVTVEYAKEIPRSVRRIAAKGTLTVKAGECSPEGRRVLRATLDLDRRTLQFEPGKDGYAADFSIYTAVFGEDSPDPIFSDYHFYSSRVDATAFTSNNVPDPQVEQTFLTPCKKLLVTVGVGDGNSGAVANFIEHVE